MDTREQTLSDTPITSEASEKKRTLYITPEKVIVNLLKADKKEFLYLPRLYKFISYLRQELSLDDGPVIFDVNFNSIERTVEYRNTVFGMFGDKIFLKDNLPLIEQDELFVFAMKFAKEYVA